MREVAMLTGIRDINDYLSGDPERVCNAMSATFEIGGVVER